MTEPAVGHRRHEPPAGFDKFCVKEKQERRGRNPAIGEDMMLAPRRAVALKCSGKLRDKISESQ
jgi:integration host factor subunit alpha